MASRRRANQPPEPGQREQPPTVTVESARLRQLLGETENLFRTLAENAPVGIFLTDADGNNLYCNAAKQRLMGLFGAEALGPAWKDLLDPEDRERVLADWSAAIRAGQTYDGTGRYRRRDGSVVWWHVTASAVRIGSTQSMIGIAQDVTQRRHIEERLRSRDLQAAQFQKIEAIGRLAGGIAHDFNNLLNVIFGYGDMLQRELEGQERPRERVGQILRAAERGAALTRQLLAFSRRQLIQPRVLDLNALVSETLQMLQRLIGEDVALALHRAPEMGRIRADPGQLEQLLMNLAVNARDAMPRGGRLTLETANVELTPAYVEAHPWATPGSYVMLAVSDTGTGMDAETRALAFEPFFTTKEDGKGTGLGLATVYGIVKQNGGHISLYSEPGLGTTFKIYLPRVDAEAAPAAPRPVQRALGNERILLVEDQELALEMLREALEGYGYDVLAAASGEAALREAAHAKGPIQLLLTDVVMPGMSGRELAERLQPSQPGMKVLFMSGYTSEAISHHGVLAQGVEFISKPFSPEDLARRIRELLG